MLCNCFLLVLDQVVGVVRLERVTAQPRFQQRPVQGIEALPGGRILGVLAQAVQQARRCIVHGSSIRKSGVAHDPS